MFFCNYFMLSHRQTSLQIIFTSINSVVFLYQHSARSRSCRRHEYNFAYFVSFVGKLKFLKFKLTFRVFEKGNAFEFYPQSLCYLPLRAFSFKMNFVDPPFFLCFHTIVPLFSPLRNCSFFVFAVSIFLSSFQYSIVTEVAIPEQIKKASSSSKFIHFSLIIISVLDELRSKSPLPQMSVTIIKGNGHEILT